MKKIKCFFVEDTGRETEWRDLPSGGRTKNRIWRRTDTGEEIENLNDLPAGAMWFVDWYGKIWNPQLEFCLVVKTPGGDWIVDSQASNCTMPDDGKQERHHCWIIEGQLPNITVSKNGITCGAGCGSIQCGKYHGFLRNGFLEEC